MGNKDQEVFYVRVDDPVDIRKNVLQSTRDVVILQRSYEKLRTLRLRKIEMIRTLQDDIKQLQKYMDKIKQDLPRTRLRQKSTKKSPEVVKTKKKRQSKVSTASDEIRKLESELASIEAKLHSLE